MKIALRFAVALALIAAGIALSGCKKPPPPPHETPREWQLLASELPAALLSVSGRSPTDVYVVGADKGQGPLVLHFDGKKWVELHTGTRGDLWWVQALPNGPALMAGAGARVLRFDGNRFECMVTPGLARQTVYGVWGTSGTNVFAVGLGGTILHYDGVSWTAQSSGTTKTLNGIWGTSAGDTIFVVGDSGTVRRRTP